MTAKKRTTTFSAKSSYKKVQDFAPNANQLIVRVSANFRNRNNPKIQQITYLAEDESLAVIVDVPMPSYSKTFRNLVKGWEYIEARDENGLEWIFKRKRGDDE